MAISNESLDKLDKAMAQAAERIENETMDIMTSAMTLTLLTSLVPDLTKEIRELRQQAVDVDRLNFSVDI